MKHFALIVVGLLLLVIVLAVPVISHRARPTPDCSTQAVLVKGPRGEPLECVCIEGTFATCFPAGL